MTIENNLSFAAIKLDTGFNPHPNTCAAELSAPLSADDTSLALNEFGPEASGAISDQKRTVAKQPDRSRSTISPDTIDTYRQIASRYRLLSADDEIRLAHAIRAGDPDAYRKMVDHNLRLVIAIARPYARTGVAFGDLIQEGNIGLLDAVNKFDPDYGCRFSTYATHHIRRAISSYVLESNPVIRKPLYLAELINKAKRTGMRLELQLGRKASDDEIAFELGISLHRLSELRAYDQTTASLEQRVGNEHSSELGDLIPDSRSLEAANQITDQIDLNIFVSEMLTKLTPREREIICRRFGYNGFEQQSAQECSASMKISIERVRQIELAAFKKFRRHAAIYKLI